MAVNGLRQLIYDSLFKIDGSHSFITCSSIQTKISNGEYFVSEKSTTIASSGEFLMRIKAPSDKNIILGIDVFFNGEYAFNSYANTTYTGDGTELTPFNAETGSTNNATASVYYSPTVDTLGDLRGDEIRGSAKGASRVGAGFTKDFFTKLSANDDLLIKITNLSSSSELSGFVGFGFCEISV